ncbi:sugar ABC transporter substrate-binding protein [Halomonas cupida]|uniref:Monosaccharide ABC transporter substrate-binding protein, CUT2 family n=1 Tax=Halomonas cupida TaxID=44933 RepID=A0A1M7JQB0_9GAMM|nr:ABC transporter substrate-binding protein [Halomonas cupida]GEN24523.1 sugar ABC transporter substrate-binding protein [Halomonas cupida]SHM55095.1 monosaccharide ABC transporter substrate-binding protein, CUT2 family [Halomonas cupida]
MKTLKLMLGAALACTAGLAMAQQLPPLEQKDSYRVGFAQMESNNPWRIAETQSFRDVAEQCNWNLTVTDAAGSAAKQVADVDSMIAQGMDAIFLPPREERALIPAVMKARAAGIPVFLVDRQVDPAVARAGEHYVAFLGSDFVEQGQTAAQWLVDNFDGEEARIIELEGTTGSSPANDRKQGFDEVIAEQDNMTIIASQSGDFSRDTGRQVMETLLQAHPNVNVVYAHNDEMAIGAIQALEVSGRTPGEDVLVVSIDGTRDALRAIINGKMGVSVESSPFFGPVACDVLNRYAAGGTIEPWVRVEDRVFTADNAADHIDEAY